MQISTLTIFVNMICNLDCEYCFVDKIWTKLEWSTKISDFIEDIMKDNNNLTIVIFWWEPLLSFDFIKKLVIFVNNFNKINKNKNIKFAWIPTNGTIYDYEMYKFLKDNWLYLEYSIDNFLDIKIDKYRIHKDVENYNLYEVISKNIENYKNIYWKVPGISITVTKENIRNLSNIVKYFINDIWTEFVSISHLVAKKWFIDSESFIAFKKEYLDIIKFYFKNLIISDLKI